VGAQIEDTTSVHEYLIHYSQIFISPIKEPHFISQDRFTVDRDLMITQESAYFRFFEIGKDFAFTGESSPSYLWQPKVPQRIQKKASDATIIIILRDPVECAYSQYLTLAVF